jgi:hypothetical protein
LLTSLAILAGCLLRRRPAGAGRYWFSAGVLAAVAGGGAALAGHLGWGHPLLFTLISACGYAVCAACISVAGVLVNRSARRDRRAGMQKRSDREQLRGPARAAGMSGQLRGSSGHARWHSLADRETAGGDGATRCRAGQVVLRWATGSRSPAATSCAASVGASSARPGAGQSTAARRGFRPSASVRSGGPHPCRPSGRCGGYAQPGAVPSPRARWCPSRRARCAPGS